MKKIFFIFAVCLLFLQFASAIDTEIKINTLSDHTVKLTFLNPDRATELPIKYDLVKLDSGETGEISTTFSNPAESFDLNVVVSKMIENNETNGTSSYEVLSANDIGIIEDITAGETLFLQLIPGAIDVVKNYQVPEVVETSSEPEVVEENVTEAVVDSEEALDSSQENEEEAETEGSSTGIFAAFLRFFRISGFATSEGGSSSKVFLYSGLGFVLVVIFALFVFAKVKKGKKINLPGKRFLSDDDEIADAEKKIEEAQDEIREVRGKRIFGDEK